jgi:hypothetical protein
VANGDVNVFQIDVSENENRQDSNTKLSQAVVVSVNKGGSGRVPEDFKDSHNEKE